MVSGVLSRERFAKMMTGYEQEQSALSTRITELESFLTQEKERVADKNQFLELVRRYTEINELNAEILREFIEKIIVHKTDGKCGKSANSSAQKIQIVYNCIGSIKLPATKK
jgi:flagellar motor switch protein FliG